MIILCIIDVMKTTTKFIQIREGEFTRILITHFSAEYLIGDFISIINSEIQEGIRHFILDFDKFKGKSFPNVVLPIRAIIDYYASSELATFLFNNIKYSSLIDMAFQVPLTVSESQEKLEQTALNKMIKFNSTEEVNFIVSHIVNELSKRLSFPAGVIKGINFTVNEIMDNVIQHSLSSSAYVMIQLHKKNSYISVCVCDNGQGIYNSLSKSKKTISGINTHFDAIYKSMDKNITRDENIGAGYGMWALKQIIDENKGRLSISSGYAQVIRENGVNRQHRILYPSSEHLMTTVSFDIRYNFFLDMSKALAGYETFDVFSRYAESMEDRTGSYLTFPLSNETQLRTRTDGDRIRNHICNLHNLDAKVIVIDFENVNDSITISFIDEVIAKLFVSEGADNFKRKYRIKSADSYTFSLIQQTIQDRTQKALASVLTNS